MRPDTLAKALERRPWSPRPDAVFGEAVGRVWPATPQPTTGWLPDRVAEFRTCLGCGPAPDAPERRRYLTVAQLALRWDVPAVILRKALQADGDAPAPAAVLGESGRYIRVGWLLAQGPALSRWAGAFQRRRRGQNNPNRRIVADVVRLRAAGQSWRQIATATGLEHPQQARRLHQDATGDR